MLDAMTSQSVYKFIKVEDYFRDYKNWQKLDEVTSHFFDADTKTLVLQFNKSDTTPCVMLIQFIQKNTFRLRFNPSKTSAEDFSSKNNNCTLATDTFDQMRLMLQEGEPFKVNFAEQTGNDRSLVITTSVDNQPFMKMVVTYAPFQITMFNCSDGQSFQVWNTAVPGIYYTPNGNEDYAIIQSVNKSATAKFIGFGEHGGKKLCKNTVQLNYFNFDNMRYRQVYNAGPLEDREPLYHSDPFFFEFNGVPEKDSVYAIYVDNPSQVCVDLGYLNSSRYMFGTRFGDLDYYFSFDNNPAELLNDFTSIIGKPRLKPRYVLGYHQGCYGYEDRGALEWVVSKYREFQIPLDGLHVDVDIQHNYQTFTIDEKRFPNPKEMFANLRAQGVKCSTNITPIISNKDPNYKTYTEGWKNNYFILDKRYEPNNPNAKRYQDFSGGNEYHIDFHDKENNFNSGRPYIGEVYYGKDGKGRELGTTGHYPDLGRIEVRQWWGKQYQYLFDMGLEMVWQDMTTPAIRPSRGDMRGFPFRLLVTDDFYSDTPASQNLAIRVWNLFSYNLHKATYDGLNILPGRENKRNFIIGRGSFAGMHRFAGLWTGDNSSTWDFLKINVAQVLAISMCGLAITGEDIGGFELEEDWQRWVEPELFIRWMVVGAFLPWFRNHYIRKGKKYFQEPFMYEEWFKQNNLSLPEPQDLYRLVLPICKHYIELRYRLLQLFYDAMFENTLNGMPICRPMFLNDPQDKTLYNDKVDFLDDQFFVRKDLLIAPLLEPQSNLNDYGKRDIYFPADSNWYCFMDNKQPLAPAIEGGTTKCKFDARLDASKDHIGFVVPTFVRVGAIIPTIDNEQYVGERNSKNLPNPITLNIYPGQNGEYTMYLDDGMSRSSAPKDVFQNRNDEYANSEYRETLITHTYVGAKTREIKVKRIHDNYTPKFEDYFFIAVLHDPSELKGSSGPLKSINIAEQDINLITGDSPEQRTDALNSASSNTWYYNEDINISFIKVFDDSPSLAIKVEYV